VHLTELDQLKGYERGAVDYISVPVIPELLRAKVSVFAELRRKSRQLESLNRELEQRVAERTEEVEKAGGSSAAVEFRTPRARTRTSMPLSRTAPDIIFSRQADGSRDYVSDRFYEYTGSLADSANGLGWLDFVHPDDKEPSMAQVGALRRIG